MRVFGSYYIAYINNLSLSTQGGVFRLERPDSISVLESHILFDTLSENYEWVVILFHPTVGTLDRLLVPLDYTFKMEIVFTLESLV
jgi:hypothetical protein